MPIMTKCEFCGEMLPAYLRTCPKCGGVVRDVIINKLWLLFLLVVLVMVLWVSFGAFWQRETQSEPAGDLEQVTRCDIISDK